jgi:transposase
VARIFRVTRRSLYRWRRRYLAEGVTGLRVRAGRGRKPRADLEQLSDYVRQSPRTFGVHRTRWTLATLANAVPSLRGFSPFGVQKALRRAGFHYKRGQPSLHSPDPQYAQKKGLWTRH